ncbi:MAG: hypothetical protein Tsb002_19790 [Wenzhouxiangellaceae bacterium]
MLAQGVAVGVAFILPRSVADQAIVGIVAVTDSDTIERPPAKAGGFRLRLKAGLISYPID